MTTRRLNYTHRKRITRDQVVISLDKTPEGQLVHEAELALRDEFPADAEIIVEAHRQERRVRFSYGTIGMPMPPSDTVLRDFGPDERPLFEVKIVAFSAEGQGQLLGLAEGLRPEEGGPRSAKRVALLPVAPKDLGHRPWSLDLSDGPLLQINRAVGNWSEVAASHEFRWLVLPEVVRRVLHYVIVEQRLRDPSDDDLNEWTGQWLHFATTLPGMEPLSDQSEEQIEDWIDNAVEQFCRSRKLMASGKKLFTVEDVS
jgi:hypothetical protein